MVGWLTGWMKEGGREFSEAQKLHLALLTLKVQILFQGRTYFVLLESLKIT